MKVKPQPLGDTAIVADGASAAADWDHDRPRGVDDVVAAFGRVAVYFEPTRITSAAVSEWVAQRLASGGGDTATAGKLVELRSREELVGEDLEQLYLEHVTGRSAAAAS